MQQKSSLSLDQGVNEDLPLTQVTSTDLTCSCFPITQHGDLTTIASDYDPSLAQTSFQHQAFNISQLPRSSVQPLAPSRPSTIPPSFTDSSYSYFPITQHGDFTNEALEYEPILFQNSFEHQTFNSSQPALSNLQPQARSWPLTDNPTMSKDNVNYPLSPSSLISSPTRRPSISTVKTGTSSLSKPISPNTAHSNGFSDSENRKSRRRAQNCAAQRAYRARKEETIKDSSVRLEILKAKLERLEWDNGSLSNTVDGLRGEIDGWRREHGVLRKASAENGQWRIRGTA